MSDKQRILLAIGLMVLVAIAPPLIWRPERPPAATGADSAQVRAPVPQDTARPPALVAAPQAPSQAGAAEPGPADTVWVTSPNYRLGFSTRGGKLVSAELLKYQSFAVSDSGEPVELVPPGDAFLRHRLVGAGGDTVSLENWSFRPSADSLVLSPAEGPRELRLETERGGARVTLTYRFDPAEYRFDVRGEISGLGSTGATLLIGLSNGLNSAERDSVDDYRNYAFVTKASKTDRTDFSDLDPGERRIMDGPFEWVGVKSKYFFAAALAFEEGQPRFGGAVAVGGPRSGKLATRTAVTVTLPVPSTGTFRYQVYLGPLEYRQLARIGHGLDDANPYGGFLRPIIQPVSVFVVNILLWMHESLNLNYGWVLILFGVIIRVLLWPLNQKAMESGIRMQAVAPLIKETQDRYRNDPQKLQTEMLRIYREHKVNPFGGCLPMLLPMPVLFALFFVFANTIEFRGVSFLWLPDLSRPDPYYIIPIIMGLSMFALSKVGQIGVPPNPQTRMLLYFMPIILTVLFLKFASGLNLYYAAQNIFSIPQQYLIAKKRLREAPVAGARGGPRSPTS